MCSSMSSMPGLRSHRRGCRPHCEIAMTTSGHVYAGTMTSRRAGNSLCSVRSATMSAEVPEHSSWASGTSSHVANASARFASPHGSRSAGHRGRPAVGGTVTRPTCMIQWLLAMRAALAVPLWCSSSGSSASLSARQMMPAMMNKQPTICGPPMCSPNRIFESASTEMISRCEAANAGPIGARLSRLIQVKNAPMYPTNAP
ncbi:hypothetical protein D3C72_1313950 [compost metagenome]